MKSEDLVYIGEVPFRSTLQLGFTFDGTPMYVTNDGTLVPSLVTMEQWREEFRRHEKPFPLDELWIDSGL